jgi:hypothetical protein
MRRLLPLALLLAATAPARAGLCHSAKDQAAVLRRAGELRLLSGQESRR